MVVQAAIETILDHRSSIPRSVPRSEIPQGEPWIEVAKSEADLEQHLDSWEEL
ncbi:MAG: hypothetical protein JWM11_58, partial [Planctomycetaceae bacterium]|nr:hypothetical protein [Planctomycetaceae bacterium]